METKQENRKEKASKWYDKHYKILLFTPIIILILALAYLGFFFSQHNDLILKDVSLSGGTTITINGGVIENLEALEATLKQKFSDINFRKLTDLNSDKLVAVIIESPASSEELKKGIEDILGFQLTDKNSSIEFTGPTLSGNFYTELLKIIFLAFILMGLVVFLIFGESKRIKAIAISLSLVAVKLTFPTRAFLGALVILIGVSALIYSFVKSKGKKQQIYSVLASLIFIIVLIFPIYYFIFPIVFIIILMYFIESIPSIAVIFAAFSDVIFALAIVDFFGIKISSAGIAAFLMLIGYSVDTDILLTTRALRKKEGSLNERIYGAFKTGILMTTTALASVLPVFFLVTGLPDSFRQIFLILALGLFADILNTWLTNAGIIKWYCTKKGVL